MDLAGLKAGRAVVVVALCAIGRRALIIEVILAELFEICEEALDEKKKHLKL